MRALCVDLARPASLRTRCILRVTMATLFGFIGAILAVLYWEYGVFAHQASLRADWIGVSIQAAFGFVIGWVVGFAIQQDRRRRIVTPDFLPATRDSF